MARNGLVIRTISPLLLQSMQLEASCHVLQLYQIENFNIFASVLTLLHYNQSMIENDEINPLLEAEMPLDEEHQARQRKMPAEMCAEGRKLLIEKHYLEASKFFSKSVIAFEFLLKNNLITKEETRDMYRDSIIPSYSNLSLCYIKMQSFEAVISISNQILAYDNGNRKARYRRALALLKTKQFQEALQDFQMVKRMDPEMEGECFKRINECKQGMREQKRKKKKMAESLIQHYSRSEDEADLSEEKKPKAEKNFILRFFSGLMGKICPKQNDNNKYN